MNETLLTVFRFPLGSVWINIFDMSFRCIHSRKRFVTTWTSHSMLWSPITSDMSTVISFISDDSITFSTCSRILNVWLLCHDVDGNTMTLWFEMISYEVVPFLYLLYWKEWRHNLKIDLTSMDLPKTFPSLQTIYISIMKSFNHYSSKGNKVSISFVQC